MSAASDPTERATLLAHIEREEIAWLAATVSARRGLLINGLARNVPPGGGRLGEGQLRALSAQVGQAVEEIVRQLEEHHRRALPGLLAEGIATALREAGVQGPPVAELHAEARRIAEERVPDLLTRFRRAARPVGRRWSLELRDRLAHHRRRGAPWPTMLGSIARGLRAWPEPELLRAGIVRALDVATEATGQVVPRARLEPWRSPLSTGSPPC